MSCVVWLVYVCVYVYMCVRDQVRDHRLQEDAAKARAAAVRVVAKHDNDDHSPNKDIVQLDIGDQSPMVGYLPCIISTACIILLKFFLQ